MRLLIVVPALLLSIMLTACDVVRRDQIRVVPPQAASDASPALEAAVTAALGEVAARFGFVDALARAREEGVVAYYLEDVEHFPIAFGARREGEGLVVDIHHFAAGGGGSARYAAVRAALVDTLSDRLGAGSVRVVERAPHPR